MPMYYTPDNRICLVVQLDCSWIRYCNIGCTGHAQACVDYVPCHHAIMSFTYSYPVILSIENHCSISQQTRMAELMKEILGDMLYDETRDETRTVLPSPEDLKRKVLVKVNSWFSFPYCNNIYILSIVLARNMPTFVRTPTYHPHYTTEWASEISSKYCILSID